MTVNVKNQFADLNLHCSLNRNINISIFLLEKFLALFSSILSYIFFILTEYCFIRSIIGEYWLLGT